MISRRIGFLIRIGFYPCRGKVRLARLSTRNWSKLFLQRGTSVLSFRASLAIAALAAWTALPALGFTAHRASTHHASAHSTSAHSASAHSASAHRASAGSHGKHRATKRASRSRRPRGQQGIEPGRVTEIQQALIREHYFSGEANGQWDAATRAAMEKYQADQGWQTKLTPDSRALKKLGLGPDYSNAINAKNSSFAPPPPESTIPPVQAAGFAAASGVNP